ncbi:nucleolar protein 14 [Cyathus striatus]|nr:nucleolar protein 14 [Cyathus striatus]
MGSSSQLTQLKTALSQAGVTNQKSNGKKRKRTAPGEKDKEQHAAKLEEIRQRLNPFDVKVTKLKHNVGGRKLKGVTGKPAQSKQAGIEQRKKTLLKEYKERNRAGGIVDRRFGENDPTMSLEERMLERFTKERQRASKGAAFNLEAEDELTHYGQSQIDRDIVKKTHFGGFDDDDEGDVDEEPARKKSKAEVMAEVIAKSKEHKVAPPTNGREQEDNFASIRELLFAPHPLRLEKEQTEGDKVPPTDQAVLLQTLAPETQDANYDHHVRELAFDKRSKPKDRTKTEEELALEEKESLEKAERQRRRRMLGLEESEDEDEEKGRKRKRGADDLDDDFDGSELGGLGVGLGDATVDLSEEEGSSASEDSSDAGKSDEENEEGSDSDEEDLDEDDDEWEGEEGEHEALVAPRKASKNKEKLVQKTVKELPYTFPCPSTHEEFLEIVKDVEDKDVPIVVQRIRALYHTSLAPDNKFKLQTLATVLIDHILFITTPPFPRFTLLSALIPHLIAITKTYPIPVAQYFVEKLDLMQKNLKRGLSRGALNPDSKTWPGLSELSLLRIIGTIWSTSDMNHAVISATRVLMGAYLGLGRIRVSSDIASGLFLCTLFLQYETFSKRLVPEAVNFLVNTILHLAPSHFKDVSDLPGSFPSPDFRSILCLPLQLNINRKKPPIAQKSNLSNLLSDSKPTEQVKADLLGLALELLGRYADIYKGIDGFIELYQPILEVLQQVEEKKLIDVHRTLLANQIGSIGRLLKFSKQARQPLQLQAHKPIPIPTYIPKFETTSSSYLRRQDPDHERNEAAKLRSQYKQERKGAIRELRKDARFLAGVQQQEQFEKDKTYNSSMKRVFGSIEGERAEEKAMEREKAKEKRRAGRK